MKPTTRALFGLLLVGWLGAGFVLTTRITGTDGLIFWLVASAWLALAVVSIRQGRTKWVVRAAVIPIAVIIVANVLALIVGVILAPESTGETYFPDVPDAPFVVANVVTWVAILSSYLVLAVGAIGPSTKTIDTLTRHRVIYHTRWQRPSGRPAGWEHGPEFYSLNPARRWAQATARLQGVSVVEIYTEDSTGTKLVATIEESEGSDR